MRGRQRIREGAQNPCGRNDKGERGVNAREMKKKGKRQDSCQKKENDMQERIIEVEADHMLLEDMYSVRAHILTDEHRCCT